MKKDSNLSILLFVESRYRVDRKRIKGVVAKTLQAQKITSPVEVSIAIVGDRKMRVLSRTYKGDDKTRNILSFPTAEGESMMLPDDNIMRLGDIVMSYPEVVRDAAREEMLVDDRLDELTEHGLMHLLGIHHS